MFQVLLTRKALLWKSQGRDTHKQPGYLFAVDTAGEMFFHANVDYANVFAVDRVGFMINLNGWWHRELGNFLMKSDVIISVSTPLFL